MKKKTIVVHSGGMDSSLCLALAVKEFGADQVLAMSFRYGQRHSKELEQAQIICEYFQVDRVEIPLDCLERITSSALIGNHELIEHKQGLAPNTLVVGRNGLMARLAAIHANDIGAKSIYMGIIEVESDNSGYRDCSRSYMDLMQKILRLDLADDEFEIVTPIVKMTKLETLELANELGVLEYLLENTITCYEGISGAGCGLCPACKLRNRGIKLYLHDHPQLKLSYKDQILQGH
jgi:7-cyano-7-deazaguanine synthase